MSLLVLLQPSGFKKIAHGQICLPQRNRSDRATLSQNSSPREPTDLLPLCDSPSSFTDPMFLSQPQRLAPVAPFTQILIQLVSLVRISILCRSHLLVQIRAVLLHICRVIISPSIPDVAATFGVKRQPLLISSFLSFNCALMQFVGKINL